MRYIIITFLIVLCSASSYAADYYVSPSGSAGWTQCTTDTTPCSAVTAMNNATAGDTVYFLGGTYFLTGDPSDSTWTDTNSDSVYRGRLEPVNSGTAGAYITFKAYNNEVPIMDAIEQAERKEGRAFGTNGRDYIIFDGFKLICEGGLLAGGIVLSAHDSGGSSDHCIIRNCEFDGGTQDIGQWGRNVEGVRAELVDYLLIENSLFYNYVTGMESSGENTSCYKSYSTNHVTITHCEFRDSSAGIYYKRINDNTITTYNFIHNVSWPFSLHAGGAGPGDSTNAVVHDNLMINYKSPPNSVGKENSGQWWVRGFKFYNNTIYSTESTRYADSTEFKVYGSDDVYIYNNIIGGSSDSIAYTGESYITLTEWDHNSYYIFKHIYTHVWQAGQQDYTTLSSWQSSGELDGSVNPGVGSLDSDPIFKNTSGNLNQIADFELALNSPCLAAGRSGVDMGANISLVGVQPLYVTSFSGSGFTIQ